MCLCYGSDVFHEIAQRLEKLIKLFRHYLVLLIYNNMERYLNNTTSVESLREIIRSYVYVLTLITQFSMYLIAAVARNIQMYVYVHVALVTLKKRFIMQFSLFTFVRDRPKFYLLLYYGNRRHVLYEYSQISKYANSHTASVSNRKIHYFRHH